MRAQALRHRYGHAQYEIAKAARGVIEAEVKALEAKLNTYPKGPTGLTLDAHKTPEWHQDRAALAKAFRRLQDFNVQFTRTYRKEIAAERAARRGS